MLPQTVTGSDKCWVPVHESICYQPIPATHVLPYNYQVNTLLILNALFKMLERVQYTKNVVLQLQTFDRFDLNHRNIPSRTRVGRYQKNQDGTVLF